MDLFRVMIAVARRLLFLIFSQVQGLAATKNTFAKISIYYKKKGGASWKKRST